MTLYPEWQLRAQQEIDAHLCGSRLPEIEDRDGLPLVDCILQETYRWAHWFNESHHVGSIIGTAGSMRFHSVGSIANWPKLLPIYTMSGIPHRALQDDVYKGMFIPKGSLVIANARWAAKP